MRKRRDGRSRRWGTSLISGCREIHRRGGAGMRQKWAVASDQWSASDQWPVVSDPVVRHDPTKIAIDFLVARQLGRSGFFQPLSTAAVKACNVPVGDSPVRAQSAIVFRLRAKTRAPGRGTV